MTSRIEAVSNLLQHAGTLLTVGGSAFLNVAYMYVNMFVSQVTVAAFETFPVMMSKDVPVDHLYHELAKLQVEINYKRLMVLAFFTSVGYALRFLGMWVKRESTLQYFRDFYEWAGIEYKKRE